MNINLLLQIDPVGGMEVKTRGVTLFLFLFLFYFSLSTLA